MIHFANAIMSNRRKIKGEENLRYNLTIWKKDYAFDILNDISENGNFVQLMNSLENAKNAISIVGHCTFYSNYKKALCLTQESIDLICSTSIGEEPVAKF